MTAAADPTPEPTADQAPAEASVAPASPVDDPCKRVGFTVTKKIGGAVVRNRMKRRLRALARELLPAGGIPGADHVLIGRSGGIERDFALLRQELASALERLRK